MATHRSKSGYWLLGLAALMIIAAGVLGWRLAGITDSEADEGSALRPPDVQLAALDGGTVGLGDFEGEIVVVDFWASWCGPCRLQARILAPLHEQLDGRVQFLA
ncbi:MAG: TlpA family protein disulfide reductase, partial [Thermoanaerobaculia bacterium]